MKQILMCRNEVGLQWGRGFLVGRSCRVERWSFWFLSCPSGLASPWHSPFHTPRMWAQWGGARVQILPMLFIPSMSLGWQLNFHEPWLLHL